MTQEIRKTVARIERAARKAQRDGTKHRAIRKLDAIAREHAVSDLHTAMGATRAAWRIAQACTRWPTASEVEHAA